MLGIMQTHAARKLAREQNLDLVEVNPKANPPVCKIMDFGRFKYEEKKKQSDAKRRQTKVELKEVKLRPKTDDHDVDFKTKHVRRFIEEGNKVKITVRFRGREISHANLGRDLLMRTAELLAEHGAIERQPLLEGRSMYIVMGPLEKRDRKTEGDGDAPSETTASTEPSKGGETIGDAIAAKAPPAPAESPAEAATETPAAKGS